MNFKAQFSFISITCVLVLLIASCGQKGDLYLPDNKTDKKKAVVVKAAPGKATELTEKAKIKKNTN